MKPNIEVFVYQPKSENISVRLSTNHGCWAHGRSLGEAIQGLLRTARSFGLPYYRNDYDNIVIVDAPRCEAYDASGKDLVNHYQEVSR